MKDRERTQTLRKHLFQHFTDLSRSHYGEDIFTHHPLDGPECDLRKLALGKKGCENIALCNHADDIVALHHWQVADTVRLHQLQCFTEGKAALDRDDVFRGYLVGC